MGKLDPFAGHNVEALKSRGPKVVAELIGVVKERAETDDETYADACSKLPEAWQATLLLAYVVRRLEEGSMIPEVLQELGEVDDRTLVMTALKEIGEKQLASTFMNAEEVLDEDPGSWTNLGPPEREELRRVWKKLFVLVGSMPEGFPPAR